MVLVDDAAVWKIGAPYVRMRPLVKDHKDNFIQHGVHPQRRTKRRV